MLLLVALVIGSAATRRTGHSLNEFEFMDAIEVSFIQKDQQLFWGSALSGQEQPVEMMDSIVDPFMISNNTATHVQSFIHSRELPLDGGLEFIHIPKVAGSTIEDSAKSYGVFWGRYGNLSEYDLSNYCSWWHNASYLQEDAPAWFRSKEKFCVTREPYDRMISEYRYLLGLYLNGSVVSSTRVFSTNPYPHCSAESLNYVLQEILMDNNEDVCDCHFVPQAKFVWHPNGTVFCDNVLRLEELPQAFDNLMISRGSPIRLGEKSNEAAECNELAVENLTNATRALIESVFLDDFIHLNYPLGTDVK